MECLPGIVLQLATCNPAFVMHCCIYDAKKTCILHTRFIMQAFRWVVEMATQDIKHKKINMPWIASIFAMAYV